MPYPLLKLSYGLQRRLRHLSTLTETKSLHDAAGLHKNYLIKPLQINELRQQFLETVETVFSHSEEIWKLDLKPIMSASYEYFRKRHLLGITDFTAEEEAQLKQRMPTVYSKLGYYGNMSICIEKLLPEDVFDYAIYRSGCQFLFDDVGKFVPDGSEKDKHIAEIIAGFDDHIGLLLRIRDDYELDDYPTEASLEHKGVPGTHEWWHEIEMDDERLLWNVNEASLSSL